MDDIRSMKGSITPAQSLPLSTRWTLVHPDLSVTCLPIRLRCTCCISSSSLLSSSLHLNLSHHSLTERPFHYKLTSKSTYFTPSFGSSIDYPSRRSLSVDAYVVRKSSVVLETTDLLESHDTPTLWLTLPSPHSTPDQSRQDPLSWRPFTFYVSIYVILRSICTLQFKRSPM